MPYLRPNGEIDENSAVRGVSVFRYEAVKDTIFKFKYDGYKNYGKILGKYMADYVIENNIYDVLQSHNQPYIFRVFSHNFCNRNI